MKAVRLPLDQFNTKELEALATALDHDLARTIYRGYWFNRGKLKRQRAVYDEFTRRGKLVPIRRI